MIERDSMNVRAAHDFDVEIVESTAERRRGIRGRPGFYWEDSRLPAVGPFASPAEALRDLADWAESGRLAAALEAKAAERAAKGYGAPR